MDIEEAKARIVKPSRVERTNVFVGSARMFAGFTAADELVFVRFDHSHPDETVRLRIARSLLDDRTNCLTICEIWEQDDVVRRTETVGTWQSAE